MIPDRRCMKAFRASTSRRTSVGTGVTSGARSSGARCRSSRSITASGAKARCTPNHSRPSATSDTTTSGSTLRPRISSASSSRDPSVSATRTVTQPACWLADTSRPTVATRTGSSW